ncbi:Allergen [Operophtera brumata]|uniref:Allergen n=1 Tax=Operophtera brumata TaxID=104452 RepID=A0A0L7KRL5_OPEBR|nr:Allergen [Operophtera brumata]
MLIISIDAPTTPKLPKNKASLKTIAAIDVGFLSRKAATSVTPVAELTLENDVYTLTMVTTLKTVKLTFKVGEEFEEERADGVTVKSVVTIEGNKIIQIQIEDSGRKSTHIREFTPDCLIVTTTAEGWDGTCIRVYEKI